MIQLPKTLTSTPSTFRQGIPTGLPMPSPNRLLPPLGGRNPRGGSRYDWRFDSPQYVTLELTRDGEIEDQIPLPATGWAAFVLCAVRRGVDPKEWLTTLLAQGLAHDIEIRAMVEWLFPTKEEEPAPASSPEIQRFESIQREFHGAEAAV